MVAASATAILNDIALSTFASVAPAGAVKSDASSANRRPTADYPRILNGVR
jgi:hypothetical protein